MVSFLWIPALAQAYVILPTLVASQETVQPQVNTELGLIRGFREQVLDAKINTFLGIPFAKPPIGKRRFSRPEPIGPWTTTYEAVRLGSSCAQPIIPIFGKWVNDVYDFYLEENSFMENCLYLNIWAPQDARNLAVMVWLHGGGLAIGSTSQNLYNGKYLSAFGNVIVVSVNYRVGLFGFLYLGSEDAPGNMGFLDQHLGIKWVYDHIEKFGGDKERITIFGESSGGDSTHLHSISSLPKYFKRAIMQSPSPLYGFQYQAPEKAYKTSINMVQALGCPTEESPNIMCCLKKLNHSTISNTAMFGPFLATLDGSFFTKEPKLAYQDVQNMDFLLGSTENEGSLMLGPFQELINEDRSSLEDAKPEVSDEEVAQVLESLAGATTEENRQKILEMYKDGKSDNFDLLDVILGDVVATCPSRHIANNLTLSGSNNVYLYRFRQKSSAWPFPAWAGVQHAADIDVVFGHALSDSNVYAADKKVVDAEFSKLVMTYWTNFAKTGNPNIGDKGSQTDIPEWPKYTLQDKHYMSLAGGSSKAGTNLKEDKCDFWDDLGVDEPLLGKYIESGIGGQETRDEL